MTRESLPDRRDHITQKVKIGANRTLYLSVDSATTPKEIFLRIKGDADAEKVVCYDTIARLLSLALQLGVPHEALGKVLYGTQDETRGAVQGDDRIRFSGGTLDYIGQHILIYYAGWDDLAHKGGPAHGQEQIDTENTDSYTGDGAATDFPDPGADTSGVTSVCDDPSRPDDPPG